MHISLQAVSKRFLKNWIFKNVSSEFSSGNAYALLGQNGSGKSTLLRIIAGMQSATAGKVVCTLDNGQVLEPNQIFKHLSFSAPGQEIIDELTLSEFLDFHFSFKPYLPGLNKQKVIELTGLSHSTNKSIGDFSSGMKQRVKLAQAFFSDTPLLFLDEPCTNLDQAGVDQYQSWIEQYTANRLVIVASNDIREYFFCKEQLKVEDYR